MRDVFRNLLFTTLIVIVGTVVSVMVASTAALLLTSPHATVGANAVELSFGLLIAVGGAMLAGMFFCIFTLFMAALTMPPTLWAAHRFNLPRPLVDVVGGAVVAYLCVQVALDQTNSMGAYGLFKGATPQIFALVGVTFGAALGLLRYVVVKAARNGPLVTPLPA